MYKEQCCDVPADNKANESYVTDAHKNDVINKDGWEWIALVCSFRLKL